MIRGELRLALAGILSLTSLIAFEAMAVATAMPVAATDLGGLKHYGLAFSFFLTSSLLGMVAAGTWNDVRGPMTPMVVGLVAFSAGLLLCGVAPSFTVLLVGRLVAGLGGGVLGVTLYVVVGLVFDEDVRPRVFAWMSSAWVLPAVVGPALAGWLASHLSWRSVFLLVPPLALVVSGVLVRRLAGLGRGAAPRGSVHGSARFDASGRARAVAGLVLAGGAALAQVASGALDPPRPVPVALTCVGVAAVALALPRLVPAGTLRLARGLPSVIAARGLFMAAFAGAESYIPFMLVVSRGLSPAEAGLSLTGGALGWTAGSILLGLRAPWVLALPRHRLMALGGLLVAVAVAALAAPALDLVPAPLVLADWTVAGLGMGLGLTSTNVLTLAMAREAERGRASSALALSDALGSVVGIGAAAAVLASGYRAGQPGAPSGALAVVFAGLALAGVGAAVAGLRVRTAPHPTGPTGSSGSGEPARASSGSASVVEP